ncbi:hypothetical protein IBX65_07580 [Candidatus Aerophobetes bacterium]|nr:hypothetical protein [Candidatus Aerophobetes bacterium]
MKDKIKAREKLELPFNKKIVLFFGQRGYSPYLPTRDDELRNVVFLILGPKKMDILEKFSSDPDIVVREEKVLTKEKFDLYLFACDAVVLHKFQAKYEAVVSSTAFQALGTGCPLFVPKRSDFFQSFSAEVLKYTDREQLKSNLINIILKDEEKNKKLKEAAFRFAKKYSGENIAKEYLVLFEKLISLSK